jgi:hypothetical protein
MIFGSYRLNYLLKKGEMIMSKKKKGSSTQKKELSEGQTIAIAVVLFAVGLVALIYGVQFLINNFFPNF